MLAYDIKCTYCGFTNVFRYLSDSMGLKFREMILVPIRKQNPLNNFRNDLTFGTDQVDSLLNTPRTFNNVFHIGLIHKSLNNMWASLGMVMYSCGSN